MQSRWRSNSVDCISECMKASCPLHLPFLSFPFLSLTLILPTQKTAGSSHKSPTQTSPRLIHTLHTLWTSTHQHTMGLYQWLRDWLLCYAVRAHASSTESFGSSPLAEEGYFYHQHPWHRDMYSHDNPSAEGGAYGAKTVMRYPPLDAPPISTEGDPFWDVGPGTNKPQAPELDMREEKAMKL
jgi:hypothetical protein